MCKPLEWYRPDGGGLRATGPYPPRKTPINWEVEDMAQLVWEMIEAEPSYRKIERAKVPGGWLVRMEVGDSGGGITFVPDPNHEWK
jgi:hypothetical protein